MLNVRLATSEMKLSSVVAETSDEGPVGMSVLKTPVDIFARKLREHNIKINIITVFIILFLFLFIIVVFLTFSKNFDLQNEIDTMKKEINALKILYRNNQAEISAIELSEGFNDITHKGRYSEDNSIEGIEYDMEYDFDDPPTAKIRNRREVLATTQDGVPVIAESYVAHKRLKTPSSGEKLMLYDTLKDRKVNLKNLNKSRERVIFETTTSMNETPQPNTLYTRMSRVMSTDAKKKMIKKRRNRNIQEQVELLGGPVYSTPNHRRKHHRNMDNTETMDEHRSNHRRHGVAVHFHGDTSRYHPSRHAHYKGDGRMSHPGGLVESWDHASWVKTLNMDTHFSLSQDKVTIKDGGLYFIYAQIFYSDKHDINGFKIVKNNELIAQCVVTSHSNSAMEKANTCFTATVDHIREGDTVRIQEIGNERISIFEAGKSFFGMVKLADLKK